MDDEREARIRAREQIKINQEQQRELEQELEQEQEQKKRKYETFDDDPTPNDINETSSNLHSSLAGPIEHMYKGDVSQLQKDTRYFGERTAKSGITYNSYLAAQAISLLSYNHDVSEIKPIYQGYGDIQIGEKLPKTYGKKSQIDGSNFRTYSYFRNTSYCITVYK